jgi:hypothetical protein
MPDAAFSVLLRTDDYVELECRHTLRLLLSQLPRQMHCDDFMMTLAVSLQLLSVLEHPIVVRSITCSLLLLVLQAI